MLGPELHVALVRNVNVGQRGHPTSAALLRAFAAAGAPEAVSFQSNGTIVFSADPESADAVAQDAVAALARDAGHVRDVFTRPLEWMRPIVEQHGSAPEARLRELTLHSGPELQAGDPAVIEAERLARCEVLEAGPGWAVVLNHREQQNNGTPLVERVIGSPASSRGLPTLTRLLEKAEAGGFG